MEISYGGQVTRGSDSKYQQLGLKDLHCFSDLGFVQPAVLLMTPFAKLKRSVEARGFFLFTHKVKTSFTVRVLIY